MAIVPPRTGLEESVPHIIWIVCLFVLVFCEDWWGLIGMIVLLQAGSRD